MDGHSEFKLGFSKLLVKLDTMLYRLIFVTGPPLKSTKKLIWASLGVSRPICVNVDSLNPGFLYLIFSGGDQRKK